MGIEVDQYRESIGKYYTVARSKENSTIHQQYLKNVQKEFTKNTTFRGERCDAKLKCELNKEICRQ
jgi:hypothetical protein